MKKLLIIACLLSLTACGFQPVYSREYRAEQEFDLSAIRVEVNNTRLGQLLKAEIERGINPDHEIAEKLYTLKINITQRDVYLFVNPDGTSSRGDIDYRSSYVLRRVIDGKVVKTGWLKRVSSYNLTLNADYASYVSEQDARKRGIVELAQDYRLRMNNIMAQINNPAPTPAP